MARSVHVTIYPRQIQVNFQRSAGRDAERVGRSAEQAAQRRLVPGHGYRTGALKRSITYGRQPVGALEYRLRLNASAKHAPWVEHGVEGRITPKRGEYLAVGKREGKFNRGRGVPKRSVAGQRAQHFLREGMSSALRLHGYGGL